MRMRDVWNLTCGVLLVIAFADAAFAAGNCLVIDDFTTGPTRLSVTATNTWVIDTQPGSMLGGWRTAGLMMSSNRYRLPALLTINYAKSPLVGMFPLEGNSRAEVIYGQAWPGAVPGGPVAPLAYYPIGCDRFRVHFNSAAASYDINFVVSAWYQDDYPYYAQGGVSVQRFARPSSFCVDVPFAALVNTGRYGTADLALPSRGIRALDFIFQSGSAGGAEQFAVSKIETLDAATAALRACEIVARLPGTP
jgi:hypothetical protein